MSEQWRDVYKVALLELDPTKLQQCIEAAESAIFLRLRSLAKAPETQKELQAIQDALSNLRVLKGEHSTAQTRAEHPKY
jgi:hypothetical protein